MENQMEHELDSCLGYGCRGILSCGAMIANTR